MNSLLVINKPKKILLVTGAYPPEIGGEATYAKLLKDDLPKQSGDKIRAIILNSGKSRFAFKLWRWLSVFLRTLYLGRYCDVIYSLNLKDAFPASRVAKLLKKPFWLKISAEDLTSSSDRGITLPASLDRLIAPTPVLLEIVKKLGADDSKLVLIPNAFSAPSNLDSHDRIRQKWGVSGKVILAGGRLIKGKNFQTLIEAMPALLTKNPELKLLIAGDGPERENLERLIAEKDLAESVMLTGILARETLFVYLRLADVFVSLNTGEGFSQMLLEAKTLGTPIVAVDTGDNKNFLADYPVACLVPAIDEESLVSGLTKIIFGGKRGAIPSPHDDPAGEMATQLIRLLLNTGT